MVSEGKMLKTDVHSTKLCETDKEKYHFVISLEKVCWSYSVDEVDEVDDEVDDVRLIGCPVRFASFAAL